MKLDAQHIIAALALVAAGWMLAQKARATSAAAATAYNDIGVSSDWWSYAGSWS